MLFGSCTAEFSIWTREAGAGGLSIAVEGPSKAEIIFEDRKDGSSGVSYTVQEPGESWWTDDENMMQRSALFNPDHCLCLSTKPSVCFIVCQDV